MEVALNSGLAHPGQFRLTAAHAVHALDRHKDSTVKTTTTWREHADPSGSDLDLSFGQAQGRTQKGSVKATMTYWDH